MEGIGNFMIKRRKIARCTSSFNEQKIKEQHMKKDGISGLPDEILIAILSLLTLKEAACTSILSRRWRYLWRYITGSFNFDSKTLLRAPAEDGTSSPNLDEMHTCRFNFYFKTRMRVPAMDDTSSDKLDEKRTTYVSWVSEVLKLHRGPCIDEMRISFDFDGQYPHDIYDWIKFALEKGVQRFELDVFGGVTPGHWHHFYHLPSMENFKFFFRTSHSHHVSQTIGSAAGFCSLRALRLVGVNIMGEVLENFLSNCPFLEQLSIVGTTYLVKLKIAGPSLKLKCLEISQCWHLENLEISAINLVSFTYWGKDIGVHFKNVPLLSELSIGGRFSTSFVSGSYKHSSYIPQIEKLKLAFYVQYNMLPKYCRELGNLKEVQIFFVGYVGDSFIGLTSVIKASPNLSKFSVRMHLGTLDREFTRSDQSAYINDVKEATKCHHQCLKVVEFVGFDGSSNTEVDLILHILEVAASLEKIIIDPHPVYYPPKVDRMEVARKHARQLKTSLPASVELVIL